MGMVTGQKSRDMCGMSNQKTSYAYDPAGNRIQKEKEVELHRYFYNTRNQLVSMEESGEERTRYQYDNLQHLVCHQNYKD